jgi:sirohydrochlorin ferrochelatase
MKECILLVGHGSPKQDASNLDQVAAMLHRLVHPGCGEDCVKVAYLQFTGSKVMDMMIEAVHQGAKKVIVHPFFLSKGMHVTKHIPELIEQARARYPDVKFISTEPLGTHEKMASIILERIKAADA